MKWCLLFRGNSHVLPGASFDFATPRPRVKRHLFLTLGGVERSYLCARRAFLLTATVCGNELWIIERPLRLMRFLFSVPQYSC